MQRAFSPIAVILVALSASCADAQTGDRYIPGARIPLADPATMVRKLGLEWKELDRHLAAAVERREKPLSKSAADALGASLRAARDHVLQGDSARAREELTKAQAIDETFAEVEFLDGVLLFYMNDVKAEAVWRAWCKRYPNDFHARNYLALALAHGGGADFEAKRNEAVDLAEANAKFHPTSTTAQITRMYAILRCGNLRKKPVVADTVLTWSDVAALVTKLDVKAERAPLASDEAGKENRMLTHDEAMQLAWMAAAAPSVIYPDGLTTAKRLLEITTATPGPFRQRNEAEKILMNR